jgi:very-short-patch-repair endonuclease
MHLYNNQDAKGKRRALRRSLTDAERKLWTALRNRQICRLKFVRQYGVGKFVLDFYCPEIRLAIEVDGSQHFDSEYDKIRTAELQSVDIKVIRFWNNEVLNNLEGVVEKIMSLITPPHLPLS